MRAAGGTVAVGDLLEAMIAPGAGRPCEVKGQLEQVRISRLTGIEAAAQVGGAASGRVPDAMVPATRRTYWAAETPSAWITAVRCFCLRIMADRTSQPADALSPVSKERQAPGATQDQLASPGTRHAGRAEGGVVSA